MPAKGHHMNLKTSVECFSCAPTVAVAPDKITVRRQLPETASGCRSPVGVNTIVNKAVDEAFNEGQWARAMLVCA